MNIYRKENTFSLSYYVHTYHRKHKFNFKKDMLAYVYLNPISDMTHTYRQISPLEKAIHDIIQTKFPKIYL